MISRLLRYLSVFFIAIILAPIAINAGISFARGWPSGWNAANWSSSQTLPRPTASSPAIIRIYAARSGRWRGIFAVHHWIVFKPPGQARYRRYEVVGWGTPVRKDNYPADGYWYSNPPMVLHELTGARAARLIPEIEAAVAAYPWQQRGSYQIWPGPNSNTFIAYVLRAVPQLGSEMDSVGIGKDYLGPGWQIARTVSGSGWQVSYAGLIGLALGWREGFELHFLGSTIGIDIDDLAIKLPGLGRLGLG